MELTVSDADLARALRPVRGAKPQAQLRVVRAMLCEWGNKDSGKLPNLSELARQLGVRRQVVSTAIRALQRKGIVTLTQAKEPIVSHRTVRMAKLRLPDVDQPSLPFELPEVVPERPVLAAA